MLTNRDKKAVEFITKNPCRADVIIRMFYPSYRVGAKRLQTLAEDKIIKRYRETPNHKYFYYTGTKPKHLEHFNLTARVLLWIEAKGYTVISFKREVLLDGAKPDAVVGIEKNGEYGVLCVEIERFNNTLKKKIGIYEQILKEQKYFPSFKVLYVCNKEVYNDNVQVINLKIKELENI